MARLERGETSSCTNPVLDIYLRSFSGALKDPVSLEYAIYDVSTPTKQITPVQVFPASGRQPVNLSNCPVGSRLGQGHYHADWTVPDDEVLGSHRIVWWFKELGNGPEFSFSEEFEVFEAGVASVGPLYVSVEDIRTAGMPATQATDAQVEEAIRAAQATLERATRQWFLPRDLTLRLDGNNSDTLLLPVPIIDIEYLKINDSSQPLDTDCYVVYNGRSFPDDRQNPRIKLKRSGGSIYSGPAGFGQPLTFIKGTQNQEIKGTFGYIEEDGTPPLLIQKATRKLAIQYLTSPEYVAPGETAPQAPPQGQSGQVMRETTDGHSVAYTFVKFGDVRAGLSGLTMDREVLDIIRLYKSPIGIATQAGWRP